jgi:hypothetical protein
MLRQLDWKELNWGEVILKCDEIPIIEFDE